jgi:hypothetical protein
MDSKRVTYDNGSSISSRFKGLGSRVGVQGFDDVCKIQGVVPVPRMLRVF